jgi:hypothetical protein
MEPTNKINRRKFLQKAGMTIAGTVVLSPILGIKQGCRRLKEGPVQLSDVLHVKVAGQEGRFLGWPANNGMWTWDAGREILVGYTDGNWVQQEGHNIGEIRQSNLARSTDGGITWKSEYPDNFVGNENIPQPSPGNINFGHPDFALRVAAMGYHGTDDPAGRFFISYDRGKNWVGSHRFNELNDDPNLKGMEITARTSYLVTGPDSCQIFMSARNPELEFASRLDKSFVAETTNGGRTFNFISWIVPWTDPYRAVMPSTVKTNDGRIVVAVRCRNPRNIEQECWIDTYVSIDGGRSWSFLSKVGITGLHNGNPPGLAALKDGRLACAYGNRSIRKMLVRVSDDGGHTWGKEMVIRDNPLNHDIGYPQLVQNAGGEMVAIYYIATEEHPHSYVEASIWNP